ncbi:hypothetical protein E2C01_100311 [Portunus trituberculatus]|uniref:Uncharacterized protein n=1 Tax=Portunus trituberculatus TaxID=210409 RepID=A0A5B7KD17_PORTR|nr:hypothetical protein [Portunus trituberculatus]
MIMYQIPASLDNIIHSYVRVGKAPSAASRQYAVLLLNWTLSELSLVC